MPQSHPDFYHNPLDGPGPSTIMYAACRDTCDIVDKKHEGFALLSSTKSRLFLMKLLWVGSSPLKPHHIPRSTHHRWYQPSNSNSFWKTSQCGMVQILFRKMPSGLLRQTEWLGVYLLAYRQKFWDLEKFSLSHTRESLTDIWQPNLQRLWILLACSRGYVRTHPFF